MLRLQLLLWIMPAAGADDIKMKKSFLILAVLLFLPLSARSAEKHWAVVNISSCFLRAAPDYESSCESQCLMGTVVEVTGADRYWRKVDVPDYKGCWTNELALAFMDEAQKDAYVEAPKMICTARYSTLFASAWEGAPVVCDFSMGDIVRSAPGRRPGWTQVLLPDGREVWARSSDVVPLDEWAAARRPGEEALVAFAKTLLGTPYMWGGCTSKYFDCSGLTKFVYLMNGILLPRNAREQIHCGVEVPFDYSRMRPGDLVFFGRKTADGKIASVTHVAMYIGDGRIIHSSQLVRINSLRPGEADSYGRTPIAVRRILGHADRSRFTSFYYICVD